MFKYLKKQWIFCILAPLFMVGEIAMDLIQPDLMATIVDKGVLVKNLNIVFAVGIKMICFVALGGLSGIMSCVFANFAAQRFANDLRKDLFKKIVNLSFQQTDKISTGSLVTRITNDVTQIKTMVTSSLRGAIRCTIMFFGGVFMLYLQSPRLALVAACGLPFIAFFVTFFIRKASPLFSVVQKRLDTINNIMQENIAGARVVKAYVKEDFELDKFDDANNLLCDVNLKVQSFLAFMHPCLNIVLNICIVMIIYTGAITVRANESMTPGKIMAAITYMSMILHSIMFMANIFQTFLRAGASIKRVREVLECDSIINDGDFDEETTQTGIVEFRNVEFAYPDTSDKKILDGISFKINKGEIFGIIGSTGSGKTSLINLIARFYDANSGEVLVDGINVKDYKLETLRQKIAVVLQKAELYSRSIEANIRWGKSDATLYDIKNAAQIAQADEFICRRENGYYTPVTEGGHSVSGGQKQRISIARAILKNAEIIIFDDATSALDFKTEAKLYSELEDSFPDTTKIIVAQRIASIKNADKILVLDNGKISALGTHQELINSSDIYRDIYNSQLKEESK